MTHHHRLRAAYLIDGVSHPVVAMEVDPSWPPLARSKGFDLVARVTDRYRCVLRCHDCGTKAVVRINVMRDHQPLCHHCIRRRRIAAAKRLGAELIAADATHRHYGHFRLACGHVVRRQYLRVEKAAAGGHAIDCEACREQRYGTEARGFGWTLDGRATSKRPGYRRYRHGCGFRQDVSIGNMVWGDASCGGCAANWAGKPSFIYMFQIDLPGLPAVKLGYSARPAKRLRHQLGLSRDVKAEVLRVMLLPSGGTAVREETACHRVMREQHPDLIVPKAVFGDAINTQGEIYHAAALPLLHALMDDVALRLTQDAASASDSLVAARDPRAPNKTQGYRRSAKPAAAPPRSMRRS